ncbi:MAG: phytoene/squalene synthase family protein [Alphaproteobacteria bacterium]
MASTRRASPAAEIARRNDPERFLAALTAPPAAREHLFAVLALEFEVARTRSVVSEPMLGEMRLQWWLDAIEEVAAGRPGPAHEILPALAAAIAAGVDPAGLAGLVEARRRDLDDEPPADLAALRAYAAETGGAVSVAMAEALGARGGAATGAARSVGTAWALVGMLRAVPHLAHANRTPLPADALGRAGLTRHDVAAPSRRDALRPIVTEIAAAAMAALDHARSLGPPRSILPTLLPARLARAHLRRLARAGGDPFDPRFQAQDGWRALRVAWGSWTGRF